MLKGKLHFETVPVKVAKKVAEAEEKPKRTDLKAGEAPNFRES